MIQLICFSKDRPLQLHGFLQSVYTYWGQLNMEVQVKVLVRAEPPYAEAYAAVVSAFPGLTVRYETDFEVDVEALIDPAVELTCFGCDDVVYVQPVMPDMVYELFRVDPDVLALSARLGKHIVRNGMSGQPMPPPNPWTGQDADFILWDLNDERSIGDWCYPWEVLGTIYRTDFARDMAGHLAFANPSQLEERGSRWWRNVTSLHHMASWPTTRLVVPTVNVVQSEFPNGILGAAALSPELLLDCWNSGLRLDVGMFAGLTPESWRVPDFYLRRCE